MGLSRKAFDASKGFEIHPGRSDLSIRLWNLGFETNSSLMRMSIIREGLIGISFQYKSINLEKQGRYLTVGIPSIVS
jgi:hypothetical protein